jgi:hypothetical protein
MAIPIPIPSCNVSSIDIPLKWWLIDPEARQEGSCGIEDLPGSRAICVLDPILLT